MGHLEDQSDGKTLWYILVADRAFVNNKKFH